MVSSKTEVIFKANVSGSLKNQNFKSCKNFSKASKQFKVSQDALCDIGTPNILISSSPTEEILKTASGNVHAYMLEVQAPL